MKTCDALTADLLAAGPYLREGAPYRLLRVTGPDAGDFLQRLCTQDVLGLASGALAPAAFLDAKGKLLVTGLVARVDGAFWLETAAEQHERLQGLLERYHFTEKLAIAAIPQLPCTEWCGAPLPQGITDRSAQVSGDGIAVAFERRGIGFVRRHTGGSGLAGRPATQEVLECLRMAAGLVRVGLETDPGTLVLEARLDDHCSMTKGCYTGQEIVARIHTYGHVNRRLCLLHVAGTGAIDSAQPLFDAGEGIAVGRVLHAVEVPGRSLRVGLGYLPADHQRLGTALRLGEAAGPEVTVVGFDDGPQDDTSAQNG
jgi:folate-binding protein YgfZ